MQSTAACTLMSALLGVHGATLAENGWFRFVAESALERALINESTPCLWSFLSQVSVLFYLPQYECGCAEIFCACGFVMHLPPRLRFFLSQTYSLSVLHVRMGHKSPLAGNGWCMAEAALERAPLIYTSLSVVISFASVYSLGVLSCARGVLFL